MDKQPTFHNTDIFAEAYDNFQNTKLAERLQKKFTPKPYHEKYKFIRGITWVASYFINVFSALTASTLVYFFVLGLWNSHVFSIACTGLFIVLLEIAKRRTSSVLFKDKLQFSRINYGLLATVILLVSMSITFSYFGSKKIVHQYKAAPTLANIDSLTNDLAAQIVVIDEQIKQSEGTTYRGTTTRTAQKAKAALTKQKADLQAEIIRVRKRVDNRNDITEITHRNITILQADNFALISLLAELLFLGCAFYLEYYDYRSYTEFAKSHNVIHNGDDNARNPVHTKHHADNKTAKNAPKEDVLPDKNESLYHDDNEISQKPITNNGTDITESKIVIVDTTDPKAVQTAIKQVKAKISTYNHKKNNGIGRPETAEKNISKWTKELKRLEGFL